MAGEILCGFLQKTNPGIAIHKPRLPRVATDQTVSCVAGEQPGTRVGAFGPFTSSQAVEAARVALNFFGVPAIGGNSCSVRRPAAVKRRKTSPAPLGFLSSCRRSVHGCTACAELEVRGKVKRELAKAQHGGFSSKCLPIRRRSARAVVAKTSGPGAYPAVHSANTHGRATAIRPRATPSQPVCFSIRRQASASKTSPFPKTGIFRACLTKPM